MFVKPVIFDRIDVKNSTATQIIINRRNLKVTQQLRLSIFKLKKSKLLYISMTFCNFISIRTQQQQNKNYSKTVHCLLLNSSFFFFLFCILLTTIEQQNLNLNYFTRRPVLNHNRRRRFVVIIIVAGSLIV